MSRQTDVIAALKEAARLTTPTGQIKDLAVLLGVTPSALYKAAKEGVAAKLAKKIETLTQGKVTRVRLNPEIFG